MNDLSNVKVGDSLIVSDTYNEWVSTVERVTRTLVITSHERFRKSNGIALSSGEWNIIHAKPSTANDIAEFNERLRMRALVYQCRGISFEKLTMQQLRKIIEIAGGNAPKPKKGGLS